MESYILLAPYFGGSRTRIRNGNVPMSQSKLDNLKVKQINKTFKIRAMLVKKKKLLKLRKKIY